MLKRIRYWLWIKKLQVTVVCRRLFESKGQAQVRKQVEKLEERMDIQEQLDYYTAESMADMIAGIDDDDGYEIEQIH